MNETAIDYALESGWCDSESGKYSHLKARYSRAWCGTFFRGYSSSKKPRCKKCKQKFQKLAPERINKELETLNIKKEMLKNKKIKLLELL